MRYRGRAAVLAVCSLGLAERAEHAPVLSSATRQRISSFFGMDVLVSAAVLVVFMRIEGSRLRITGRWLPVLALLLVGVSLAFPMFLYMRERNLEQTEPATKFESVGDTPQLSKLL